MSRIVCYYENERLELGCVPNWSSRRTDIQSSETANATSRSAISQFENILINISTQETRINKSGIKVEDDLTFNH